MRIVGIDNGLSGGIAIVQHAALIATSVMPVISYKSGKKNKRTYDLGEIVSIIENIKPAHVFVEKAQAMPSFSKGGKQSPQGGVTNFTTGYSYGAMLGILAALRIAYTIVHPRTWQKVMFMGMPKTDTKKMSYIVCQRLWPNADWKATPRCRIAHDGKTDAAMIAEYGRRTIAGAR